MEVIKPSWVKHHDDKQRRQCIFSSDIDSEGIRLATGGMDGVIKIWRVSGLFESVEQRTSTNLMASMSRHNGSVLCVRWSSSGQLASSSDDTIILIWQLDSRPIAMRGNLEGLNDEGDVVENYKVVKRLIGHQSDTVGVEWSPDGKILASCGLDGTICFWNCDASSSQTLMGKFERAHAGFIKGLAWDPSGKFLASQSDDGSCVVWNVESLLSSQTSPFTLDPSESEMFKETVLEKNFVNMSKMTFFHRPGWSPDGSLLALANSTNRQLPAVALIERSNWQGPGTFFIGHSGPVEAVKFNPRLFLSVSTENTCTERRKEMLCAVASQDGQVSIWGSCSTSPLLVLQDLFEHSVMDLAWSPNGSILVAVSYDGAAVAVKLNPSDLGLHPLPTEEQIEHLRNCFGNRSSANESSVPGYVESVKVVECLRENEQFLMNHPKSEEKDDIPFEPLSIQATVKVEPPNEPPQAIATAIPAIIQSVPMIVNGKKRITPQLMTATTSIGFGNNNSPTITSSQPSQQPGRGLGPARMRDEDFLIHRKLLERTSSLLISGGRSSACRIFRDLNEEIPDSLSVSLTTGTLAIFSVSLEVVNQKDPQTQKKLSSLIQSIQNSQIQWKERFRGNVYLASGTRKYSAFALKGGDGRHFILVLTSSGRRYFPPIALDCKAIHLQVSPASESLSVISESGAISIWNLKECRAIFSDSSIGHSIMEPSPVKLVNFDLDRIQVSFETDSSSSIKCLVFNSSLGCWTSKGSLCSSSSLCSPMSSDSSVDRIQRIEKLKATLLSPDESTSSMQSYTFSELEFELSLIFINLRNGTTLTEQESSHFERALAIYSLKLGKECRVLKARELIQDLKILQLGSLIDSLLKPLFSCSSSSSLSSSWQDFLAETF